jgi:hypothetical protein
VLERVAEIVLVEETELLIEFEKDAEPEEEGVPV